MVEIFSNVEMSSDYDEQDVLGRVYEYCLQQFASQEGKNAGEFYTPSCIVRTIVEILQPYSGRIYDPACGSGGMFVQSAKFVKNHQKDVRNISIYGQEYNSTTWKMCKMNLAIRGLEGNLGEAADTFTNDQHPTLRADFIMANPPFNLKVWGHDQLIDDPRWKYGIPPESNANFAWMEHMIHHMAPNGKMGLVLANGSLSSQTGGEGEIRKNIIDADLVEGIVALPSQLFYNTGIPVCLWFLAKDKVQKGKTLFVDARNMGYMATRRLRELDEEKDIKVIAKMFEDFRNGKDVSKPGVCAVASIEEIAKQDYVLTPGRYVGIADEEEDGEPYEEKVARLSSELSELFKQSREQEEEIRMQLGKIGISL